MIRYRRPNGQCQFFKQLIQRAGSVFPPAFQIALPCSLITAALTAWIQHGRVPLFQEEHSVLKENAAWGGFSALVGFLIVFRTAQSYNRFWDGCTSTHRMRAEWFDGCSSLISFCKHSKIDPLLTSKFQNTLVRLFSMLHAVALAEIEDCETEELSDHAAFKFPIIDAEGIDETSLLVIKSCSAKVELIFQWIQQLIVENISTGVLSIPPPILSRSFQEISNGMVAFHDALKISYIPFPFPYAQTCDFLLLMHWLVVPFVVCHWVTQPAWAAVFSFIQVFVLWALNLIAVELENPFGSDANDIDDGHMQDEMNQHLVLLMSPSTKITPTLSTGFRDLSDIQLWNQWGRTSMSFASKDVMEVFAEKSFSEVWTSLATKAQNSDTSFSKTLSNTPVARRSYGRRSYGPDMSRKTRESKSLRILPIAENATGGENRSHSFRPSVGSVVSQSSSSSRQERPAIGSSLGKKARPDLESPEVHEMPPLLEQPMVLHTTQTPALLGALELEFEASIALNNKKPSTSESHPEREVQPGKATSAGSDLAEQIGKSPSLEPPKVQASGVEKLRQEGCVATPPGIIRKELLQSNGIPGSDQADAEHSGAQCGQDEPCSSDSPRPSLCRTAEVAPSIQQQQPAAVTVQSQDVDLAKEARSLDTRQIESPVANTSEPAKSSEGAANSVVLDIS